MGYFSVSALSPNPSSPLLRQARESLDAVIFLLLSCTCCFASRSAGPIETPTCAAAANSVVVVAGGGGDGGTAAAAAAAASSVVVAAAGGGGIGGGVGS